MYNYFMLIGIIGKDIEIRTSKNGSKYCILRLFVSRPFRNVNGEFDSDFFDIFVWESLSEILFENFKKGSKIGVKGRLQSRTIKENDTNKTTYMFIAERLIFVDSKNQALEESYEEITNEIDNSEIALTVDE